MSFTFSGMDIYANMSERELKSKFDSTLLLACEKFMKHYSNELKLTQERIDFLTKSFFVGNFCRF